MGEALLGAGEMSRVKRKLVAAGGWLMVSSAAQSPAHSFSDHKGKPAPKENSKYIMKHLAQIHFAAEHLHKEDFIL